MNDFDIFKNRWEITGKINLKTPLRIGGGQNAGTYSLSQAPVLLSYNAESQTSEPFIPGSSLKGVLRSSVERIVRTFDKNMSCVSIGDKNHDKVLCGECITCYIFGSGSKGTGAKIRVLDCHLSNGGRLGNMLDERPHCATKYKQVKGLYEIQTRTKNINKKTIKVPEIKLRFEELVVPNISFDINIRIDNADEHEVALVLLALDEFNYKRSHLGGGASRGHGFIDILDMAVTKKTLNSENGISFKVSEDPQDMFALKKSVHDFLYDIDDNENTTTKDFDVFFDANSPANQESGNIVFEYEVTTVGEFQMPGADEVTVTNSGIPIIPGSTIKGFLRHKMIDQSIEINKIDDIFGATNGNRSRLIISDTCPEEEFFESGEISDEIPDETTLKMWIVFDNLDHEDIQLIRTNLELGQQLITGKRVAGAGTKMPSKKNNVTFNPISKRTFRKKSYLDSIL